MAGTRFLSFAEFKCRYNIKLRFLSFYGVIKLLRKTAQEHFSRHDDDDNIFFFKTLPKANKPNRYVYKTRVERKQKKTINSQNKSCFDRWIEENDSINCLLTSHLSVYRGLSTMTFFSESTPHTLISEAFPIAIKRHWLTYFGIVQLPCLA